MAKNIKSEIEKNRVAIIKAAIRLEYESPQLWYTQVRNSGFAETSNAISYLIHDVNYSPGMNESLVYLHSAFNTIVGGYDNPEISIPLLKKVCLSKHSHQLRGNILYQLYKGHNPPINKTKALAEFLARGFIHTEEARGFSKELYTIACTIAPLVWPKQYKLQQDGLQKMNKIGIRGYTQCPASSLQNRYYLR